MHICRNIFRGARMLHWKQSGEAPNQFDTDPPVQNANMPTAQLAEKEQTLNRIDKGKPTSSVIDEWLTITGNLETDGDVLVNGKIKGDIRCNLLIVGQQAEVEGLVIADEVVVRGVALGVIRANRVRIEKTGRVDSEVFHKAICVEEGAEFVGMSRRSNDPMNELATSESQAAALRQAAAEMRAADTAAADDAEDKQEAVA